MFEAILLGLIQGLTEFLPVSSSGHLVLTEHLLGKHNADMLYELLLHIGTLFAVILVFRKEIKALFSGLLKTQSSAIREALLIITTCIPTGIIGILFEDKVEALSNYPLAIGSLLVFMGIVLFMTKWLKPQEKTLSFKMAFLIGIVQGIAIIPGISRSGSTIAFCLALGISRKKAGQFSFLISIPVIGGAALLKLIKTAGTSNLNIELTTLLSILVAFLSGWISLVYLLKFVEKGKLYQFAYYLVPVGLITLFLF